MNYIQNNFQTIYSKIFIKYNTFIPSSIEDKNDFIKQLNKIEKVNFLFTIVI